MPELLIYTPQISSRVNYIFPLFFGSLIRTPFSITTDEATFKLHEGPKLNYSNTNFPDDKLQIVPYGLLSEKGMKIQGINVSEWNQLKIFFQANEGNLPFDVFSASFYLVSRYEEYFHHEVDEHERFYHTHSLAYKNDFLDHPLINLWAEELKKIILAAYPGIAFSENNYSFIPTIDIDTAYAHIGRSVLVFMGSYLKAVLQLRFTTAIEKKLVLLRLKRDPYDTYEYQETIFAKYRLHPICFFLAASKRELYDRNISPESRLFKKLVKRLSSFAEIGIHPSYQSNSVPEMVDGEIKNVEQNIAKKITCSRQHFLRLKLPETYRCLAKTGVTDDYTMAYATATGFRASICTPFFFYDIRNESILPVRVHSSAVMDGTLHEYLGLSPNDAITIIKDLISKVKKVNGEFIPIWHNHTINDHGYWKGWKTVFEKMIETAK